MLDTIQLKPNHRAVFKKGRSFYIKLGDKDVEYNK